MLLEGETGLEVVAEAQDLPGALGLAMQHRPLVAVLDLSLPGGVTRLDAIRELRAAAPETAIVALTLQADPAFARRALLDGADGFVLKDLATERLADAVRATARGAGYLAPHDLGGARAPGAVSVSAAPRRGA